MQTVSPVYIESMGQAVREPSRMRLTFAYPSGTVVYTNSDIVKVTEKKSAHLIAGALPTVELTIELINLDGTFNPNDVSGLHDMIVAGVPITYEFGYDIPNIHRYGYEQDGSWHDYGMETGVPYGFLDSYSTEWIPGGEVRTTGGLSYDKTSVTITAKDYLSFLDDKPLVSYSNMTLAQIARLVIDATDYPEVAGVKKLLTGPELDTFATTIMLGDGDDSPSAKEHLQTIAHAGCVQMYIDRLGYLHLDNDQQLTSPSQYELPLDQQAENPSHNKEQMPKELVVTLASEFGLPIETTLNGGGEAMEVENPFIVTTAEGEALSDHILTAFIPYRNTADIVYRGEPALDILDHITLSTEFGTTVDAIIEGTELTFDGSITGALSVRYQLGENTPKTVTITGAGNFVYPLGSTFPSETAHELVCVTDIESPTYQWSYYAVSNGAWLDIGGETGDTLVVTYDSSYFANDSSVRFRCVVNGLKGAMTQVSKIQLQKSADAGYRGVVVGSDPSEIDIPKVRVGDTVLLDNTDEEDEDLYGEAYVYNGEEWVTTVHSDDLSAAYKDALQLAKDTEKDIYSAKLVTDLLVVNEAFIRNLKAKNAVVGLGDGTASSGFRFRAMTDKDMDGTNVPVFDVMYDNATLFKVDITSGYVYFGPHFIYDPELEEIRSTSGLFKVGSDGQLVITDGVATNLTVEGLNALSGDFKGQLDTITIKTIRGSGTYTTAANYSGNLMATDMYSGIYCKGVVPIDTLITADGTVNGKTISRVKFYTPWYTYDRYREWAGAAYRFCSITKKHFKVDIACTDSTVYSYTVVRGKRDCKLGAGPPYPTFNSSICSSLTEGDVLDYTAPYSITNLRIKDPTLEELYIYNLPTVAPSGAGRVWKDGSGYLRIV